MPSSGPVHLALFGPKYAALQLEALQLDSPADPLSVSDIIHVYSGSDEEDDGVSVGTLTNKNDTTETTAKTNETTDCAAPPPPPPEPFQNPSESSSHVQPPTPAHQGDPPLYEEPPAPPGGAIFRRNPYRLLDPRLTKPERELEFDPDDNLTSCFVFGAHRLPPAYEMQRKMMWKMFRLPRRDQLNPELSMARREAHTILSGEMERTRDLIRGVAAIIKDAYEIQVGSALVQTLRSKKANDFIASEIGSTVIETYLQLHHRYCIDYAISVLIEVDRELSYVMLPGAFGPGFLATMLERSWNSDFSPLDIALEIAQRISHVAYQYGNARDDASAVSLHLRAIAHVLPWYPSAWLMDGWEAQTCGLGPFWSTTLISIGIHLGNMHMVHTANTVFELALQMQTLTAAELRQIYTRQSDILTFVGCTCKDPCSTQECIDERVSRLRSDLAPVQNLSDDHVLNEHDLGAKQLQDFAAHFSREHSIGPEPARAAFWMTSDTMQSLRIRNWANWLRWEYEASKYAKGAEDDLAEDNMKLEKLEQEQSVAQALTMLGVDI